MAIAPEALRLKNPIQYYAWGSRFAIAELCGRQAPSPDPEAELWMGAHPKAPSTVTVDGRDVALDAIIARHPEAFLGKRAVRRFGPKLPFLFKVLAAQAPLSIQAHPDQRQARDGFDRENRVGIPLGAARRNYRDSSHKPEIICALTEFWGLNGFRPMDDLQRQLLRFSPDGLAPVLGRCSSGSEQQSLGCLFGHLLRLEGPARDAIIAEALGHARRCSPEDPVAGWILALGAAYPGDIGIVAPTILNLVCLEPGQAMYLPARQLHAYLKGVGIELMANSDNVLRGGLTAKHVDGDELMRVLHFVPGPPGIVVPQSIAPTEEVFPTPAAEFQLSRIQLTPPAIHETGADHSVEILLVASGALTLEAPRRTPLHLVRGESVVIPATSGHYALTGGGVCYKAALPLTKD